MNKTQQSAYHNILQGVQNMADEILLPRLEPEELYNVFFQLRLDQMADLTGAAFLPQAPQRNALNGLLRHLQADMQLLCPALQGADLFFRDTEQICLGKRLEGRDAIDTSQKFRRKVFAQTAQQRLLPMLPEPKAPAHRVFASEV